MLDIIFNRKKFSKKLAKEVVNETGTLLKTIDQNQADQFQEIKAILFNLTQKIEGIENNIATKELRDRNNYGHLQYKISELESDLIFDTPK